MTWWGWLVGGAILLGSELTVVSAQFYLVFIGAAAVLTGAVVWALPGLAPWVPWATFAVLALASMTVFRSRVYERLNRHSPGLHTGVPLGDVTLDGALAPGESCRVEHGGSYWTVRNDSETVLSAGSRVRIAAIHGLTLLVRPHQES